MSPRKHSEKLDTESDTGHGYGHGRCRRRRRVRIIIVVFRNFLSEQIFCIFLSYFSESSTESEEAAAVKRQLKAKRRQLQSLLTQVVFPRGFSGKYLDDNFNTNIYPDTEKAVEVMKKIIEDVPNGKSSKESRKRQRSQKPKRSKKLKKI